MAKIKDLRGFLWKQGVNGLGVGPKWLRFFLPYKERFDTAVKIHDADYDKNGDAHDRFNADSLLLTNMVCVSVNGIQVLFSIIYYITVRLFGWMFYRYNR